MVTNFMVRNGEIGLFTFNHSPGIPKRIAISPFSFKRFICDDLAIYCV